MADAGFWALVLTLIVSVYAAFASALGARKCDGALLDSARNGVFAAAGLGTAACGILFYLLLSRDYGIQYVYQHVNDVMPTLYVVSAFWAGKEGSLLVWLWFAVLLTAALILVGRAWKMVYGPYVVSAMAAIQAFLALVILLFSNPFVQMAAAPVQGQGMNPLLQNIWMVAHPPVVFVAYAAYGVPFALAVGGLAVGRLDGDWLALTRRWALFAWLFLGAGILMGAWWAYLELGWGGYWAWDPVENSSLIPWLTGTALLHSLMVQQRRNAFKRWNVWLAGLTFVLCLLATFVTRSGIIQSVHAFGRSAIGYYFLAFIGLCLAAMTVLAIRRRGTLGQELTFKALLSRETSLLLTNLLFVGAALVVLVGTLFPALVELLQGRQAALEATFYERTVGPLLLATVALIGICPWLAWGSASGERLRKRLLPALLGAMAIVVVLLLLGIRQGWALVAFGIAAFVGISLLATFYYGTVNRARRTGEALPLAFWKAVSGHRRRYGAHLVHLGIVLMAIGLTGSSLYQEEVQIALAPEEQIDVGAYSLTYDDFVSEELPDRQRFVARVDVERGARRLATLRPEKAFHWNVEQWVTEVSIHSSLKEDLYLILAGFEADGLASFRILINPLVIWLWIGGGVLLGGGVVAWWPAKERGSAR